MRFNNPILDMLFGSKVEAGSEKQVREDSKPADVSEEAAAWDQEEQAETVQPVAANELELSADHELNELHILWEEQVGGQPSARLLLEGCEDLPEKELEQELDRLHKEITQMAKARLKEIEEKLKEEKEKLEKEREKLEKEREKSESQKPESHVEDLAEQTEDSEYAEEEAEEPEDPVIELDAFPLVFISSDKLRAWLMVFPPVGQGKEIGRAALEDALKENGVVYGLDEGLLDSLPKEQRRYFHLFPAAKGEPAIHGEDGQIKEFFDRHVKGELTVDDRGRVDYTSLNLVQGAEKGAVICEAIPPTKAVHGRTVLGKELLGKDGKAAILPKGQNTEISEDGTLLLASLSGHVEYSGRVFQVKSTMDVSGNVDYSTGSINFPGDVHIRGDVCSGFSVKATGSIAVDGVVEAGVVEAGGDLVIAKGIVGDKECIIRARRDVYTKYLENGIVHARGKLITDCILHSEVYCDEEVQVTTGRGAIIGGRLHVAREVQANIIGSKSETMTTVILGGQPCADFEKALLRQGLEDLEYEMEKLERQSDSPAKAKRMGQIRLNLSVNKMKLGQFEKEEGRAGEVSEEQGSCRLRCQIIYPGVMLSIGDETIQVTQEVSSCNARLVNGEICLM